MQNELGLVSDSLHELASMTLQEASNVGLISEDLPIFDENGDIDQEKLRQWNPQSELKELDISASVMISKQAMAAIISTLTNFGSLTRFCDLKLISRAEDKEGRKIGTPIITGYVSTNYGIFRSTLSIYESFDEAVMMPIAPGLKGYSPGLSVATYALVHTLGHCVYAKLQAKADYASLGGFTESTGWSRASIQGERGRFLNFTSPLSWKRDSRIEPVTQTGQYSPSDEFAEMLALYLLHNQYMSVAFPDKYEAMEEIVMKYNLEDN